MFYSKAIAFVTVLTMGAAWPEQWSGWPPRAYLLASLVSEVQPILDQFHPESGRFGTEPWICQDQNLVFPLAAAWALEDDQNPWYHDERLVGVVAKAGEALVDAMDDNGMWTFRKKDHSTWGQIHMPWTYSRWIRAYHLMKDALPPDSREKWEKSLLLGYAGILKQMDGGTHNIPTHNAMGLYIAGECFNKPEWKEAAKAFMARVAAEQSPEGFWSEHFGPVVGYNQVYIDALGVYYHFSRDPVALEALQRAARFHSKVLWPDGSAWSCIDERMIYHAGVDIGNVGFSWTPEGRGFLLRQLGLFSKNGEKASGADYAASLLLYGGAGEALLPAAAQDAGTAILGNRDAVSRRLKPWQWAVSAYACAPSDSRWIQDRQNLLDLYHDALGVVAGGGNTKLQPYWSTFTVGDPGLVRHRTGDEAPDFTPDASLRWTPDKTVIVEVEPATRLELAFGEVRCSLTVECEETGTLALTYAAPPGVAAEAHLPLLSRAGSFSTAAGKTIEMGDSETILSAAETGSFIVHGGLRVSVSEGASVRWPARQHNPYAKDGLAPLASAKLVLVMPFDTVGEYRVELELMNDRE